jgi:hypothetical protein
MSETYPFDDDRGLFPDRITAAVPRGFRDQVRRAAVVRHVSMGELIRRALSDHIGDTVERLVGKADADEAPHHDYKQPPER